MRIEKINKIVGYRIFRDCYWPAMLPEFTSYNLIYGWNGTGKTTLSNVFRRLEQRRQLGQGEADLSIDGRIITDKEFATNLALPLIKVFNKEFIDENIFNTADNVTPIFILGKDSIEKQKAIQEKTKVLSAKKTTLISKQNYFSAAENDLDAFCVSNGKLIKELLRSSGVNPYSNYNKTNFHLKCEELLKKEDVAKFILSDSAKEEYKKQKDSVPKEKIALITFTFDAYNKLVLDVENILNRTVISRVIDYLKNNPDVEEWVEIGLAKHKEKAVETCLFCERPLPEGRIEELEGHFNDEFKLLMNDISTMLESLNIIIETSESFFAPSKGELYDHLQSQYAKHIEGLKWEVKEYVSSLRKLQKRLLVKKTKLFERIDLNIKTKEPDASKIEVVNSVLRKHNVETENFNALVNTARQRLEESLVAEVLTEYKQKADTIDTLGKEVKELKNEIETAEKQIRALEREVIEHQQPAEELNRDIIAYLGRDELRFEVKENGYQIYRYKELARNLSEGERTAIAFLYFLKSLKDKHFDLGDGIVVIDDPVSSLDSNSLFYAFGFLKERTKGAGQLFILTHNFTFFKQVKNWFNYLKKTDKAFYMLNCKYIGGHRTAVLTLLDNLLRNFESEYHYLFSIIYDFSTKQSEELKDYYLIPNIARRLLEAFLAFRHPSLNTLHKQLDKVEFDTAKKARIYRFVNVHSHGNAIEEGPEHDLSVLTETPAVLIDLLKLIEVEDKKHYDQMVAIVKRSIVER